MSRYFVYVCFAVVLGILSGAGVSSKEPAKADGKAKADDKKPRVDLYGDPLPPGAIARMGTVRLRHHDMILWLALSPDGKLAASAGGGWDRNPHQVIRLWDVATGNEIRQFVGHQSPPRNVIFSPDGKTLASVAGLDPLQEETVRIWDVASGKQLHVFEEKRDRELKRGGLGWAASFSPDSKSFIYATLDRTIKAIDVRSGKPLRSIHLDNHPSALLFAANGSLLIADPGQLSFWNVKAGKLVSKRVWDSNNRIPVVLANDGRTLICVKPTELGTKDTVVWWDLNKHTEIRSMGQKSGAGVRNRFVRSGIGS